MTSVQIHFCTIQIIWYVHHPNTFLQHPNTFLHHPNTFLHHYLHQKSFSLNETNHTEVKFFPDKDDICLIVGAGCDAYTASVPFASSRMWCPLTAKHLANGSSRLLVPATLAFLLMFAIAAYAICVLKDARMQYVKI